jgi:hypothetical protein
MLTMALSEQLSERLTRAIRDRDQATANVIRMLKTRLAERTTARGFTGPVDDTLVLDVIGAYRKQLQKALAEYDKLGERGALRPPSCDSRSPSARASCPPGWTSRLCARSSPSGRPPSGSRTESRPAAWSATS